MNIFKKLLHLPSPKELGWSPSNSLSMRIFSRKDGYTWEDWYEKMEKEHPIKFFFTHKLKDWFNNIKRPVSKSWYWFVSHFVPSRRYHMLDLRQPEDYSYGWLDSDRQILFANFNILNNFVKNEMPDFYCPSEEEVKADPHLASQRNNYLEIKAIHHWWNVTRKQDSDKYSKLVKAWCDAKGKDPSEHSLWKEIDKLEIEINAKEQDMLFRLIKIRKSLWT